MKDENVFKQKLYPHTMPVRDGIWEAIEAQLPPVEKKKRFPFFWLMLFGCAMAGGSLMFGLTNQKTPDNLTVQSTLPSSDKQAAISSSEIQTLAFKESPEITSSLHHHTAAIPTTSQDSYSSSSTSSSSTSGLLSSTSSGRTKKKLTPQQTAVEGISILTTTPAPIEIPTQEPASEDAFLDNTSTGVSASSARYSPVTPALPGATMVLDEDDFLPFSLFQPDPECYVFGGYATGFALSAEVLAGPGFSIRSFEDTGGESSLYADARNETERKQYAWTFGARLNLHLHSGLGAKLGLSYHQAGDILDYRDSLATQSSTRIDSFWASDGTFLYADTVRVFIPGTLVKKIHNTYKQVDIPLLLSYELILARSIVMINVGPVFNLTSTHKGQILDTALHPRPLAPDGSPANQVNAYRNQLGISLYFGAGVLFPLGSHTSAVIEPRFLYRIKPVTLPQYTLKEHRHFAGLHLGLRYHFN